MIDAIVTKDAPEEQAENAVLEAQEESEELDEHLLAQANRCF